MKWFKRLVPILFLFQISTVSISQDSRESLPLNPFERAFNFIIRYVDIPGINLNPDGKYEEIVIIDYKGSFERAIAQIKLHNSYVSCLEKTDTIPIPRMRLMSSDASDEDIIKEYGEHVDRIIDYISMLRMSCHPPTPIKLPVYKNIKK